mgnify:FL=1
MPLDMELYQYIDTLIKFNLMLMTGIKTEMAIFKEGKGVGGKEKMTFKPRFDGDDWCI